MNQRNRKGPVVLVFGESVNDIGALGALIEALCPDLQGRVKPLREPIVLIKGVRPEEVPGRARQVAEVVSAVATTREVRCVFAHQDADAVEPAHEHAAQTIEEALGEEGCDAHAVCPAWEIEAWWLLWPDALAAVCRDWAQITHDNKDVGRISDAKKYLQRATRKLSRREYQESDSKAIAQAVRDLGLVGQPRGVSASFTRFRQSVETCCSG